MGICQSANNQSPVKPTFFNLISSSPTELGLADEKQNIHRWLDERELVNVKETLERKWHFLLSSVNVELCEQLQWWDIVSSWCSFETKHSWMTISQRNLTDNDEHTMDHAKKELSSHHQLQYFANVMQFGTWGDTNLFVEVREFQQCIRLNVKMSHSTQDIFLYMHMEGNTVCLKLTQALFHRYISFSFGSEHSMFIHLKERPLVFQHDSKSFDNLENTDPELELRNWIRITGAEIHGLAQADVIKINFVNPKDARELAECLILSHWPCRFLHVKQDKYVEQMYIDSTLASFDSRYLLGMLQSRDLKISVKLNRTFVFKLLDSSIDICTKTALVNKVVEYFDIEYDGFCLNLDHLIDEEIKQQQKLRKNNMSGRNTSEVRWATITPTRVLLYSKQRVDSCRILRDNDQDCFLRVQFRDENGDKLNRVDEDFLEYTVGRRLRGGLKLAGELYDILGGSNSHLREHGTCLFRKHQRGGTAQDVRNTIGDLKAIRCVAQYMARVGLAFSHTQHGIRLEHPQLITESDVIRNGYNFSDGIGRISKTLAGKMKMNKKLDICPSAFQIRLGGAKGVVTVDPSISGDKVILRESMVKFESRNRSLDVQKESKPKALFLNHQIVTILSQLGVKDEVFLKLQENHVDDILKSFLEQRTASRKLSECLFGIINMNKLDSNINEEPFFRQILMINAKQDLNMLLEKARIPIPISQGRNMMGVLDDTGTLQYGEVFIQYSKSIYANDGFDVLQGTVVVSKMPCLHPGDVRKFTAKDVPELHHMRDVIVFPRKGTRPHPDEMSGSDLDGDEYWVSWHLGLIFERSNHPAMDYRAGPKQTKNSEITDDDMIEYLMTFIQNDVTSIISRAHLTQADKEVEGIFSQKALQLAKLHSQAVDSAKTGEKVRLSDDLVALTYPDFLKKSDHKPTYESERILGQLYRQYKGLYECMSRSYKRHGELQTGQPLADHHNPSMQLAQKLFAKYNDQIRILLKKYGFQSEIQLYTRSWHESDILSIRKGDKYKLQIEFKIALKQLCSQLRSDFNRETVCKPQEKAESCFKIANKDSSLFPWLFSEYVRNSTNRQLTQPTSIWANLGGKCCSMLGQFYNWDNKNFKKNLVTILMDIDQESLDVLTQSTWIFVLGLFFRGLGVVPYLVQQSRRMKLIPQSPNVPEKTTWYARFRSLFEKPKQKASTEIIESLATCFTAESWQPDQLENIGQLISDLLMNALHKSSRTNPLCKMNQYELASAVWCLVFNADPTKLFRKDPELQHNEITETMTLTLKACKHLKQSHPDLKDYFREHYHLSDCVVDKNKITVTGIASVVDQLQQHVCKLNNQFDDARDQTQVQTRRKCKTCNSNEHFEANCPNNANVTCFRCHRYGHYAHKCYFPRVKETFK